MKVLPCLLAWSLLAAAQPDVDAATGLIKAPGWEEVRINCGGCHSYALITQQHADRDTWLAMIRWMQASQNLWQFTPEVEAGILDYLSSNYAPRQDLRRPPIPAALMPPPETPNQTEEND